MGPKKKSEPPTDDEADTFWHEKEVVAGAVRESTIGQEKTKQKKVEASKERENKAEQKAKEVMPRRVNIQGEKVRNGLAQLILTVVEMLRELMEKQALRRIEHGSLTDNQAEQLGLTFMNLKREVGRLKTYFDLEDEDLNINLGPLLAREPEDISMVGKASAVEILDRLLAKGVVARGDIVLSVAEVDLLSVHLGLVLASIDTAQRLYQHTK